MKKNQKFLIAGIVIISAISFLVYMGVKESGVYFMTVAELKAQQRVTTNQGVRMSGSVLKGSITEEPRELILNFKVIDEEGPENNFVNVVYKGVKPDSFKEEVQVILEGKYDVEKNLFKATTLLVKCPSRYEGETPPEDYKPGVEKGLDPGIDKGLAPGIEEGPKKGDKEGTRKI